MKFLLRVNARPFRLGLRVFRRSGAKRGATVELARQVSRLAPTLVKVCDFAALDTLIADRAPPEDLADALARDGVELVLAG